MFDGKDNVQNILMVVVVALALFLMISYIREDKKKCSDIKDSKKCKDITNSDGDHCVWTGENTDEGGVGECERVPTQEELEELIMDKFKERLKLNLSLFDTTLSLDEIDDINSELSKLDQFGEKYYNLYEQFYPDSLDSLDDKMLSIMNAVVLENGLGEELTEDELAAPPTVSSGGTFQNTRKKNNMKNLFKILRNRIEKKKIGKKNMKTEKSNFEGFSNYSDSDNSFESFQNTNNNKLPSECYPKDVLSSSDLLPNDANSKWAQANPNGQGSLGDKNFLTAGYHVGVNTVGQSLRNANRQLRSDPPNPQVKVSPWMQTTIEPDANRKPMEIGS